MWVGCPPQRQLPSKSCVFWGTHVHVFMCVRICKVPYKAVAADLSLLGFEGGWGSDVASIKDMMLQMQNIIQVHLTLFSNAWKGCRYALQVDPSSRLWKGCRCSCRCSLRVDPFLKSTEGCRYTLQVNPFQGYGKAADAP
jgi:hypothetical protein